MRSFLIDKTPNNTNDIQYPDYLSKTPDQLAMEFFPVGVPFSKSRLAQALPQMIDHREQWLDPHGSFVATATGLLPLGGQVITKTLTQAQLSLYLIADMGLESPLQASVFHSIEQELALTPKHTEAIIIGNGDWAYPRGPESHALSEQHRLQKTVFNRAKKLAEQAPFLVVLGNHEYGDHNGPANPEIFLEMARNNHLDAPGRYYLYQFEHPDWAIDYIVMDTTSLPSDADQQTAIRRFLESSHQQEKTTNKKRWRILVGHHPFKSYGLHGDETSYLPKLLGPALADADLYLSGHEHDIQFFEANDTLPALLICGTASHNRAVDSGEGSIFHSSQTGYAKINFEPDFINIELIKSSMEGRTKKSSGSKQNKLFDYRISRR